MVAKCLTELEMAANELKEYAKEHPSDVMRASFADLAKSKKIVDVDGLPISLVFSLDKFPDGAQAWHLSISSNLILSEAVLEKVRNAFFREEFIEMPSILFGNKIKQYFWRVKC